VPYKHSPHIRALLDQLEVVKKVDRERRSAVSKERRPLCEHVRGLKNRLAVANARRHKLQFGGYCRDHTEEETACMYPTDWKEVNERITSLQSQLLDAEVRLALFDQEHNT